MTRLFYAIWMSMYYILVMAQSSTTLERDISLIGAKVNSNSTNIRLLWVPDNPNVFQSGIDNGYKITRYVKSQNGIDTPLDQLASTAVVLASGLYPVAMGDILWQEDLGVVGDASDDLGLAAEHFIYYSNPSMSNTPNLADAFQSTQDNLERLQYGMAVAFQDYGMAQKMALGYEDQSAVANTTYIYRLEIIGTEIKDVITLSTDLDASFSDFGIVTGYSELGVVKLEWDISEISKDYYAYDILRREATGGGSFSKITNSPYVFFESGDQLTQTFTYQDPTVVSGVTYEYKLQGQTIFGIPGKLSDIVIVEAIPHLTGIAPIVTVNDGSSADHTVPSTAVSEVQLSWNTAPASTIAYVEGYNVYRSEHATKGFTKLNQNLITATDYADSNPLNSAFYIVSLVDQFGKEHESYAEFAQIVDVYAPPVPKGLRVRVSDKNQFELTWSPLRTPDLEGYLIYAQLDEVGITHMVANDIIQETVFRYDYPSDILADSICFTISSIDHRGNESNQSQCVTEIISDRVAPSKPLISLAEGRQTGNLIGWSFSVSDDVSYHEIQRKSYESPEWRTILTIPAIAQSGYMITDGSLPYEQARYADIDYPDSRALDYRIVAFDEAQNRSYSKRVSIKPYVSRFVGSIDNFKLNPGYPSIGIEAQPEAYSAITNVINATGPSNPPDLASLQILVDFRIITQSEYDNLFLLSTSEVISFLSFKKNQYWTNTVYAQLDWNYKHTDDLLYFQIYRSTEGKAFIDYIDVYPQDQLQSVQNHYDDVSVYTGKTYMYKVLAIHSDGRFSEISKTLRITLQNI